MKKTKWTEEVIQFMIENYKGKDNIELAELLNERFNLNTNGDRVCNVKANLKRREGIDLRTGINRGCFPKGNIPVNKGTKGLYNVGGNRTSFKKGNIPPNKRPVGSERINVDGYIEIKTKEPNTWELKHRVVYQEHYGEIPKGYNVIFLDGNRQNLDINNLKLVNKAENLIMNRNKLYSTDKEITNTGTIIAKLIDKTNKLGSD